MIPAFNPSNRRAPPSLPPQCSTGGHGARNANASLSLSGLVWRRAGPPVRTAHTGKQYRRRGRRNRRRLCYQWRWRPSRRFRRRGSRPPRKNRNSSLAPLCRAPFPTRKWSFCSPNSKQIVGQIGHSNGTWRITSACRPRKLRRGFRQCATAKSRRRLPVRRPVHRPVRRPVRRRARRRRSRRRWAR